MSSPSPSKILEYATGGWATAALGTAVMLDLFTTLDHGSQTAAALAQHSSHSVRGTQALLDALLGMNLVQVDDGVYSNSPESATFLVKGKPGYLGDFARFRVDELATLTHLPHSVRSGNPALDTTSLENPYWEELVLSMAAATYAIAITAGEYMGIAGAGPLAILDVGGGAGAFSAALLTLNAEARSTQLDWARVNDIASRYVAVRGVADRFDTINGDFHEVDLGVGLYDIIVYSQMAHTESSDSNREFFSRARAALKPGGKLLIADFVKNNDGTGAKQALLFSLIMLLQTPAGDVYREGEYREWLTAAGFHNIEVVPTKAAPRLVIGHVG